ncbi:four helix bundle protein [Tenacibaculum aiptasiae]|uniref:four helix bundle protein n=1 Tax=Tenacibaculum aiptasiae TaxID=426481 RepID=UPI002330CDAB|nr:four helix bundle protein [Tenacibaculum aiptasiae]
MKESIVQNKSFQFSLKVISLYKKLQQEKEFIISKQLLRSGTSIGANIEEALAGQSKRDFIAKMSISSKEARETKYWLRLLKESDLTNINVNDLLLDAHELIRLLTAIVKTSQQNTTKN